MQNRMELFSTAAKLFVWHLSNSTVIPLLTLRGQNLKCFFNCYKYLGVILDTELSDDKDIQRQLRYQYCATNKQWAYFCRCSDAVKNVRFRSLCKPMYASQLWCYFRKSCMQRWRVAYNFGCRTLYNLPWRASVSSHHVQCNIPAYEAIIRKYKYLFLERCRKSRNAWLRALMQSDCLNSSLFFEHYNRILLCDWVLGHCSVCSFESVPGHNAVVLCLALTSLGISVLLCSSVVPSVTGWWTVVLRMCLCPVVLPPTPLQNVLLSKCLIPENQPPMPLKNVLFCTFLSTCVEQNMCVCTMDLVSAEKIDHHHHWCGFHSSGFRFLRLS